MRIFQLDVDSECFPGAATPAFHFPPQCAHFRQFLKARRGQATGNCCKMVQLVPKSDHKLVAKGGKRAAGKRGCVGRNPGGRTGALAHPASSRQVLSLSQLGSRHAPDTNRHLAIAHNPLPSNNHLSQIHLRPRAGSTLITLISTPPVHCPRPPLTTS